MVLVMLFFILVLLVYCFLLSVFRADSSVAPCPGAVEPGDLSGLSLGELFSVGVSLGCGVSPVVGRVRRARRVRVGVSVVVRGRSGRRLGGAARSGRLSRVVGRLGRLFGPARLAFG